MNSGPRIVVMGVSAVGKSTVGAAIADRLDLPFIDADDLHSPASIEKMAAGLSLTDQDRDPWLRRCGQALAVEPSGGVLACSALARRYRDVLRAVVPLAIFVHLEADRERVLARAMSRDGHFMPVGLLTSQFDTLEPLEFDERGITIDAATSIPDIVDTCVSALPELASRAR